MPEVGAAAVETASDWSAVSFAAYCSCWCVVVWSVQCYYAPHSLYIARCLFSLQVPRKMLIEAVDVLSRPGTAGVSQRAVEG